jgi:hypothetical protein
MMGPLGIRPSALVLLLAVIGLAWRLLVAAHVYPTFRPGSVTAGDADLYLALATNLRAGHGYSADLEPPHRPFVVRPPAYALFLAAVLGASGGSQAVAVVAQVILDLGSGLLLAGLASRLWPRRRRLPLIVFALWATCPAVGSMAGRLLAEVLGTFLVTLALFLLAEAPARRPGSIGRVLLAVMGGAALMLAVLARPQLIAALLCLPLVAVAFARVIVPGRSPADRRDGGTGGVGLERRLVISLTLAALVGVLVADAPWMIRNWRVTGELVPVSRGYATRALAMGIDEKLGERKVDVERRLADAGVQSTSGGDGEDRDPYLHYALAEIRTHPFRYLRMSLARAVLLWASPRTSIYGLPPSAILDALRHPGRPGAIGVLAVAGALGIYYTLLLGLAILGAVRHRRDPALVALLLTLPVALTLGTMWFHLEARYALPGFPVVVLAAAHWIDGALAAARGGPG